MKQRSTAALNRRNIVRVQVKPSAKTDAVELREDGSLRVTVKAVPRDGKANAAVIDQLARHFGVPQRAIKLKRGASSRDKVFEVKAPASLQSE